jgi:hypothetical protein
MRIVIETEEQAEKPAHPSNVETGSQPTAEDAGASTAESAAPSAPPGGGPSGEGDAQNAGPPPQWLVDDIARLREESQAGDQTGSGGQTGAEDAGRGNSD